MAAFPKQQKTGSTFSGRLHKFLAVVAVIMATGSGAAMAGGSEETNYKYVPATIESRFYGTIRKIPAGKTGLWSVNNREIMVTGETKITEEYGKAVVGAYVEVEGTNTGKTFIAGKITVKRARK